MGWFSSLFSSGAGTLVSSIGEVADRFIESPDEKSAFKLQVQQLVQQRDSEVEQSLRKELESKERILVAELNQGDSYTKRARPTVVYAGLVFIGINYVVFPLIGRFAQAFGVQVDATPLADFPVDFWAAWGGICATWSIGRSLEKRGNQAPLTRLTTGSKPVSKLLE
ncbi:3TM-type holin [Marinomonas transparens]|uniref:Holin of 3TMs, for gene-transfer release n=1 Tax=Marinomonas transparens TaxID=2795388 RepID=A0A934MZ53_9GAMM|nr:3TM-type holin [Marinomonas transparens]MBJ7537175.1 hypothetical protein [Marinomonas transparens]